PVGPAPAAVPAGNAVTEKLPAAAPPSLRAKAYGQLRMNAALPCCQTDLELSSANVVTSFGLMVPTHPAALSSAATAFALSMLTTPSGSTICPPALEWIHSRPLTVRPS